MAEASNSKFAAFTVALLNMESASALVALNNNARHIEKKEAAAKAFQEALEDLMNSPMRMHPENRSTFLPETDTVQLATRNLDKLLGRMILKADKLTADEVATLDAAVHSFIKLLDPSHPFLAEIEPPVPVSKLLMPSTPEPEDELKTVTEEERQTTGKSIYLVIIRSCANSYSSRFQPQQEARNDEARPA